MLVFQLEKCMHGVQYQFNLNLLCRALVLRIQFCWIGSFEKRRDKLRKN